MEIGIRILINSQQHHCEIKYKRGNIILIYFCVVRFENVNLM